MGINKFLFGIISLGDKSLLSNKSAIQIDPPTCLPLAWRSSFKAWCPVDSWPCCGKWSSRITIGQTCGFLMGCRLNCELNWEHSFTKAAKNNQLATTLTGGLAWPFFLYNSSIYWFKQWSGSYSMQFLAKYFMCNKRSFLLCRAYSLNKRNCNRWEPR